MTLRLRVAPADSRARETIVRNLNWIRRVLPATIVALLVPIGAAAPDARASTQVVPPFQFAYAGHPVAHKPREFAMTELLVRGRVLRGARIYTVCADCHGGFAGSSPAINLGGTPPTLMSELKPPTTVGAKSQIWVLVTKPREIGRFKIYAFAPSRVSLVLIRQGCVPPRFKLYHNIRISAVTAAQVPCRAGTSVPQTSPSPQTSPLPQGPPLQPLPPTPTASLAVSLLGFGSGTVSAGGAPCPGTCSFPIGTTVSLTPNPSSGSMFFGWGGACSGVGGCTVTLNGDRAVSALYNFIGDLNSDGYVGCADEAILKAHYGQPGNVLDGDLNGDGVVNVYDLSIMESHWNPPPSDPNPCPS